MHPGSTDGISTYKITSNLNNLSNNSSDPLKPAACCHSTLDSHEWLLMMMLFIPGCDVLLMRFHGKVTSS